MSDTPPTDAHLDFLATYGTPVADLVAEVRSLRAQVATLTGERDRARRLHTTVSEHSIHEEHKLRAERDAALADWSRVDSETLAFLRGDIRYREMAETLRTRLGLPVPGRGDMHGPVCRSSAEREDGLIGERDSALADAAAQRKRAEDAEARVVSCLRELERHRHGTTIEGDHVCPHELAAVNAGLTAEEREALKWAARIIGFGVERLGGHSERSRALHDRFSAVLDRLLSGPPAPVDAGAVVPACPCGARFTTHDDAYDHVYGQRCPLKPAAPRAVPEGLADAIRELQRVHVLGTGERAESDAAIVTVLREFAAPAPSHQTCEGAEDEPTFPAGPSRSDNAPLLVVAECVLECARAWEPNARIIGNVRAGDIARLCAWVPNIIEVAGARPAPRAVTSEQVERAAEHLCGGLEERQRDLALALSDLGISITPADGGDRG